MKKFFDEFKQFIAKGNVIDMAVAVVIGGAFGKIVTALVDNIIMPLVSLLVGGLNVSDWKWVIKEATETTAETSLGYGAFLQSVLDFLIVAFCIFCALKVFLNAQNAVKDAAKNAAQKLGKKDGTEEEVEEVVVEAAPVESQEDLLREIRDLLREKAEK